MLALIKRQDWLLNAAIAFLAAASLLILYSISADFFWRQFIWLLIAVLIILLFSLIDWRALTTYRWLVLTIYLFVILFLIITLIAAPAIRASKSWLVIGPVGFQVSEFAKMALILVLAFFFARGHLAIAHWRNLLKSFVYFAIPAVLILMQPDLGSVVVLFGIWFSFLLVSGIRWRHLLIGFLLLIILTFLGWNNFLQDYQKERITALFNPERNPLGINYSVIQSKIAIGSAGFFGKGFQQGTQVQLGFLPETQSDFIFAAFIEEWGFLGGLLIIFALGFLVWRIIKVGLGAENNFVRLICLGTVILFLTQFTLNVGSNLGLLPVIGISFPFLSYGGSNLLANAILIGIIQSIAVRSSFLKE